jgi:hypothetical protein
MKGFPLFLSWSEKPHTAICMGGFWCSSHVGGLANNINTELAGFETMDFAAAMLCYNFLRIRVPQGLRSAEHTHQGTFGVYIYWHVKRKHWTYLV